MPCRVHLKMQRLQLIKVVTFFICTTKHKIFDIIKAISEQQDNLLVKKLCSLESDLLTTEG